jgi:hypothetical protein
MKILLVDIETAPNLVWTWGLFNQNIAINQIKESSYILSWGAKWLGGSKVEYSDLRDGKKKMLKGIYDLLEDADVVIHYNGVSFDVPILNQEFAKQKWTPPAPYQQLDLLTTVRKKFRMTSNKLDFVSQYLGIGEKIDDGGFETWIGCMNNDPASWALMKKYNKHDVELLDGLYRYLKPWISNHPNHAQFTEVEEQMCPYCGSTHIQKRGLHYAKALTYQRFRCMDCGAWSRNRLTEMPKEKRASVLVGV